MKYFYSRYWGIFARSNPEDVATTEAVGFVGFGYSGNSSALNDIHKQNLQGVGPLPAGEYLVSNVHDDPIRGRHTCTLQPAVTNKMYGRSGFLIHGDTPAEAHAASDGCIIMPYWVRCLILGGDEIEVI